MKGIVIIIITAMLLGAADVSAQDYEIEIPTARAGDISRISRAVSIDNIRDGVIHAYANESELMELRTLLPSYAYRVQGMSLSKSADYLDMADNIESMRDWAHYPTYEAYVSMMQDFAARNPNLAELVDIGESAEGRSLLALRITGDGDTLMRPRVLLTSTMHGDETCGFILCLRLIDFLLENYGTHEMATRIINNTVLYINPLANPDGTYHDGNHTVAGARRYNANNVDLNRNFPQLGALAKGAQNLEPETVAMMKFAESRRFALSANMHGGDEVLNYPWDSFYEYEMRLADKDWFVDICRQYIDTLRTFASNSMMSVTPDGYVFGSEWYKVTGGRQDWMLYSQRCREITIELSNIKLLRCDLLESYWQRNRDALMMYVCNALQGISGQVTDINGNPIEAHIYLDGHDANYSSVVCDRAGVFTRLTLAGESYNVCAVADGYETQCRAVSTSKNELSTADFVLNAGKSEYTAVGETKAPPKLQISVHDGFIDISSSMVIDRVDIADMLGRNVLSSCPRSDIFMSNTYNLADGIYVIKIQTGGVVTSSKITITK